VRRTITGLKIRERRRELGIKQIELAQRLGISPSYLNLIERNKRGIGGALLISIGRELSLTLEQLDGSAERRLREELIELATDQRVGDPGVELSGAEEFLARFPDWARLATLAYKGLLEASARAELLEDRLAHDPELAEVVHSMLTEITALRSTAEILDSKTEIPGPQRRRFEAIVLDQSTRLSSTGAALAAYFEPSNRQSRGRRPLNDAEAFVEVNAEYLASLNTLAVDIRGTIAGVEVDLERAFRDVLPKHDIPRFDANSGRNDRLDALARAVAERHGCQDADRFLRAEGAGLDHETLVVVREEFLCLLADGLRLPEEVFLARGREVAWGVEKLIQAFDEDRALVCRRFAAAAARGTASAVPEGVPRAAHVEMDFSGEVLRRRGALDLLPRAGGLECPLWPAHHVRSTTAGVVAQAVVLYGGEERLALALARARSPRADLLVFDPESLDGSVYEAVMSGQPTPVGATCRLCAHFDCAWRREPAAVSQ
jgi:predicted transcriptional regulator/transcriptional regulator with XRE-family HTH domain